MSINKVQDGGFYKGVKWSWKEQAIPIQSPLLYAVAMNGLRSGGACSYVGCRFERELNGKERGTRQKWSHIRDKSEIRDTVSPSNTK